MQGQLVILKMLNPDEMKVGLILSILVLNNAAYFITKEYLAHTKSLQYFKSPSSIIIPTPFQRKQVMQEDDRVLRSRFFLEFCYRQAVGSLSMSKEVVMLRESQAFQLGLWQSGLWG
jgi:hypothetical protein